MARLPLLMAATALVGDPSASEAALPPGAFGWMSELAGHCWSPDYADGTRDRQCYTIQYDRYLRGTIEILFAGGGRPSYRGDSVFFWEPERSQILVHYWSSAGNHGVMTRQVDGETVVPFGSVASGRVPGPSTSSLGRRATTPAGREVNAAPRRGEH